jgi:hypothetical protein
MRIAAVAVLLVAVLAGCADPAAGPDGTAAPQDPDPVALVGNWLVKGTDEEEGTVLRLAAEGADLSLFRPCGMLTGGWRADGSGIFLAAVPGEVPCDGSAPSPPPAWLLDATGYRLVGADRELLDAGGRVVAHLVASHEPAPVDTAQVWSKLAEPPAVTDEARQALRPAAPLPTGLTPITAGTVAGRWVARDGVRRPQEPYVELKADRTWTGSDGCNTGGGRWTGGSGGTLLATSGPVTEIGCDNHPAMGWLYEARRAAIDGDQLVLLDAAAKELGRLAR